MNRLEKVLAVVVAGAFVAGCSMKEPKPEDYENRDIYTQKGILVDHDGDGDVDVILQRNRSTVKLVAPDMVNVLKKVYDIDGYARTPRMTPKIKKAATRTLRATRDLQLAVDTEMYRRNQE